MISDLPLSSNLVSHLWRRQQVHPGNQRKNSQAQSQAYHSPAILRPQQTPSFLSLMRKEKLSRKRMWVEARICFILTSRRATVLLALKKSPFGHHRTQLLTSSSLQKKKRRTLLKAISPGSQITQHAPLSPERLMVAIRTFKALRSQEIKAMFRMLHVRSIPILTLLSEECEPFIESSLTQLSTRWTTTTNYATDSPAQAETVDAPSNRQRGSKLILSRATTSAARLNVLV